MPRHQRGGFSGTEGFSGAGTFDIGKVDFATSLSSLSSPGSLVDADDNYEQFLNSWERRPSRFMEATFRDSATSQDDMAVPTRKTLEKAAKKQSSKNSSKDKPKKKKGSRKWSGLIADDSNVGNFVAAKPRPPSPKKSSDKHYLLENQGDNMSLTPHGDLSASLTDKLGRNLVMNQNKTLNRRRASAAALTAASSQGSGDHSRSRSRSPGRKGRSNSTGRQPEKETQGNQKSRNGHEEDHQRHGKHKREVSKDGHQHKTKSGHPRKHNASGEHHLRENTPKKTDDSNRRHKHKSPSPDDSSRRHKQKSPSPDDSSRRNHHKHEHSRHRGDSKSPEGTTQHKRVPKDRDSSSPTAHKAGDHRSRRRERTDHERGEEKHGHVRARRTSSAPHRKERRGRPRDHHGNERHPRRSVEQHDHVKRRSKSHSPITRHARPHTDDNRHHARQQQRRSRERIRGRHSANPPPPEPPSAPEVPAPGPRRTRGSMIVMQAVPNSAIAATKLKAQQSEKSQHLHVTKHRREGHSREQQRSHHPRPGRHHDSKTPPGEHHRTERKPRPKLKRFKSKSTGHLPAKRPSTSKRGSTSKRESTSRRHKKRSNDSPSGRRKERSKLAPSGGERVAALQNAKASSLRNLVAARMAAEDTSGRGTSPGPFRRRASIGDRQAALHGTTAISRRNLMAGGLTNQNTGSKSSRFKEALLKSESMESEDEDLAPRPAVKRHSSLSRLETKSRKSMMLNPQSPNNAGDGPLGRSRMAFLDEDFSFSDSEEDSDYDDSSRQMGQDRLARSIQRRLQASDVSEDSVEFDVTETKPQESHPHRMTDNLDHVDLTALRPSQVQEVLARARAVPYYD